MSGVYSRINKMPFQEINSTRSKELVLIDGIAALEGTIGCIEGWRLLSHAAIAVSDHRSYTIDLNLEKYFANNLVPGMK